MKIPNAISAALLLAIGNNQRVESQLRSNFDSDPDAALEIRIFVDLRQPACLAILEEHNLLPATPKSK